MPKAPHTLGNMLPRIESCSIFGNMLLGWWQQVASCMKAFKAQHVAKNRTAFYFWQHVAYKIKVTTNVASNKLPRV